MKLRPYQQLAFDNTLELWKTKQAVLCVMATALGKSIVGSRLIDHMVRTTGKKAMVFAHREELINQLATHLHNATGLDVGIEMGDSKADISQWFGHKIVVSTVQSLTTNIKRLQKFKPEDFCVLWNDESHHIISRSNQKVVDHFKQNPDLRILGVTATPERGDKCALGQVFDDVAINYGTHEGFKDGWLVRPKQMYVHIDGIDLRRVRTTCGDLNQGDLSRVLEEDKNARGVMDAIERIAQDKKTIVFTASVAQAEKMCTISNMLRPESSRIISGTTPDNEREEMHRLFKERKITRLFNCAVLTEGYDDPDIEIVAVARPTKSRSLYIQIIGRGLRPVAELANKLVDMTQEERLFAIECSRKPECLILDFCGNAGKHKLVTLVDVLGGAYPDDIRAKVEKKIKSNPQKVIDIEEELAKMLAEQVKSQELARKREEDRHRRIETNTKFTMFEVDPFDVFGIRKLDNTIKSEGIQERQRLFLERLGVRCSHMSKKEAQAMIVEHFKRKKMGLPTFKQQEWLIKFGYNDTPSNWRQILNEKFGNK